MIRHILNKIDYIAEVKDTKNTNDDGKFKGDTSKHQDGNESVDITETSYALRNVSFINTAKEEASFIKRLMTMNFKLRVVQYVIDIVTLCGKK